MARVTATDVNRSVTESTFEPKITGPTPRTNPAITWTSRRDASGVHKTDGERIAHIVSEYAALDQVELSAAVLRLQKRLGGDRTKQALEAIQANQPEIWIPILLLYYDKTYEFDLQRHEVSKTIRLNLQGLSFEDQVNLLLQTKHKVNGTSHPTHRVE